MSPSRLPTLWRYSLRQTQRRPARAVLTLLGIVIGVATIVAVSVTTQAARRAYREMFEALTGRASLEVVAEAMAGFEAEQAQELMSLPLVMAAVPLIQKPAALVTSSGPIPVTVLGIDADRDRAARDYELEQGHFIGEEPGVLLGHEFASTHGIALGATVRLLTISGLVEAPVVGLLQSSGAARFHGGAVVFMALSQAQRHFDLAGKVNSVQLVLADGAEIGQAEAAIRKRLNVGQTVRVPSDRGQLAQDSLLNIEQILAVLSVVSMVAGAFVILNAFQMNLAERRRQFAILRALGATRLQVTSLLLREAAAYGVAGTALGIAAGMAISLSLTGGMERLLGTAVPSPALTLEPLALAILLGPAMTLLATFGPARRAGRRAPIDDLLGKTPPAGTKMPRRWAAAGLVLITACGLIDMAFIRGWLTPALGRLLLPAAMVLGLAGSVLALGVVLGPLMRLVGAILGPLFGIEGRLAVRQLRRHASRTALTVGALMVAIVITIGPGNEIRSALDNLHAWFDNVAGANFHVLGADTDLGFSLNIVSLPESLGDELAQLDGVERVDRGNWFPVRAGGRQALLIAATYSPDRPEQLNPAKGNPPGVMERLALGEVVIGTALAQSLQLDVGDELELATSKGPRKLRVAGKCNQYHAGGMTVHMQREAAGKWFDLEGAHVFSITADKDKASTLASELKAFCRQRGLLLHSREQLRRNMDRRSAGTIGFLWVLMALVFVVASLGIANTLTMNVLEQTRELGLLRAIGMRRNQVRKMVLAQASAIALASAIPGVVLGIVLAYMMNLPAEWLTGHRPPFEIHLWLLAAALAVTLCVAVVAAIIPADRAARLRIVPALHYE
ncbi:MAG: FtsX-like permease family protein [Pirellulales bacterium]